MSQTPNFVFFPEEPAEQGLWLPLEPELELPAHTLVVAELHIESVVRETLLFTAQVDGRTHVVALLARDQVTSVDLVLEGEEVKPPLAA